MTNLDLTQLALNCRLAARDFIVKSAPAFGEENTHANIGRRFRLSPPPHLAVVEDADYYASPLLHDKPAYYDPALDLAVINRSTESGIEAGEPATLYAYGCALADAAHHRAQQAPQPLRPLTRRNLIFGAVAGAAGGTSLGHYASKSMPDRPGYASVMRMAGGIAGTETGLRIATPRPPAETLDEPARDRAIYDALGNTAIRGMLAYYRDQGLENQYRTNIRNLFKSEDIDDILAQQTRLLASSYPALSARDYTTLALFKQHHEIHQYDSDRPALHPYERAKAMGNYALQHKAAQR